MKTTPKSTGQVYPDAMTLGKGVHWTEDQPRTLLRFVSPVDEEGAGVEDVEMSYDVCIKHFDYYHRTANAWYDSVSTQAVVVRPDQRRQPPDDKLLAVLNAHDKLPFQMRTVRAGPDCAIFVYPYIDGGHQPKSWSQMYSVLELMVNVHKAGYVHGDILPQNLVFATHSQQRSLVIDWDMARLEVTDMGGTSPPRYVHGYNVVDFVDVRHPDAKPDQLMLRTHDCYSLAKLIALWFDCVDKASSLELLQTAKSLTLDVLRQLGNDWHLKPRQQTQQTGATGSPQRLV